MTPPPRTHVFAAAGQPDSRGQDYCRTCGLPERNRRHAVPAVSADTTVAEARRLGEKREVA